MTKCAQKENAMLHQIITVDKSWLYHYNQQMKLMLMKYSHTDSFVPKNFIVSILEGNELLTILHHA